MIYTNTHRTPISDFAEYQALPQLSHSDIKGRFFGSPKDSVNLRFGKICDAIISETVSPIIYSDQLYQPALKCVQILRNLPVGRNLSIMDSQVAFTGEIHSNGFVLPTKVLLDLIYKDLFAIEFKITFGDINSVVERMQYVNQVFHQKEMSGVNEIYILITCVDKNFNHKETKLIHFSPAELEVAIPFWERAVNLYGI